MSFVTALRRVSKKQVFRGLFISQIPVDDKEHNKKRNYPWFRIDQEL